MKKDRDWTPHFGTGNAFYSKPSHLMIKMAHACHTGCNKQMVGLGSNFARLDGGTIKKEVQIEKVRDILSSIW